MPNVQKKKIVSSMAVAKLRISGIEAESIVDGPGLRYVVFTQGCPHQCFGCHNPETHALNSGYEISIQEIINDFLNNPLLSGMTFSGGEPFLQAESLVLLANIVKKTGKTLVTYTGYTYERLLELGKCNPSIIHLLELTDILIDGPFQISQRDLQLSFRGSANQRILYRMDRQRIKYQLKY